MILIIAEKPSLARNISAAVGGMSRGEGCFSGGGYIVTWAFGHLFSLCDIETYSPDPDGGKRWTMKNLPCFPQKYLFELRRDGKDDSGVKRQFEVIRELCRRPDTDTIVNAGDSDREGEIIVRTIIDHALTPEERKTKRLRRLWLPEQTPETIRRALADPPDEKNYDGLAHEGYARMLIDWLYGVNLTRYATLKTGVLLRVGRVIVPVVRAIYDRDMAIKSFLPEKYYTAVSREKTKGKELELTSKRRFAADDLASARALCEEYNAAGALVTGTKRKKDTLKPGKLYSLTKLQNQLSKKYKMSMTDSLAAAQKLYESGYITYPRTNSEYLASAEKDRVKTVIVKVAALGYPVTFRDGKSIFDDSKIESHSALTPTVKIPDKTKLGENEAKVYGEIIRRFAAVFCSEDCVIERTELVIDVGRFGEPPLESFTLKGNVILEPGWTKYDDCAVKDRTLPKLRRGDRVNVNFCPTEKETSPPKHHTVETLNNYLKNPFREELAKPDGRAPVTDSPEGSEPGGNDDVDYRAIFEGLELGTEATRTGIIENARKSGYIQLKNDVYTILPDGCFLIESLARMGIGMDKYKTAEVGRALKKVYRGDMKITESLEIAKSEIAEVFAPHPSDADDGFFGDSAGRCPLCGGEVVRNKFGYGCKNYRNGCKFRVNGVICGRVISLENARLLLSDGRTARISDFISKNGKSFDAALKLEDGRAVFDFQEKPEPPTQPLENS